MRYSQLTVSPPVTNFFLWALIVAGAVVVLYLLLYARLGARTLSYLNVFCGPLLLPLFWLHGVLFVPPNNWAMLDNLGFVRFWFFPQRSLDIEEHTAAFWLPLALTFVPFLFALFVIRRFRERVSASMFWLWPAIGLALWYLSAVLIRMLPDMAWDMTVHSSFVPLLENSLFISDGLIPFAMGLFVTALAYWLTGHLADEQKSKSEG